MTDFDLKVYLPPVFVLIAFASSLSSATTVKFVNHCPSTVNVYKNATGAEWRQLSGQDCTLDGAAKFKTGMTKDFESCSKKYDNSKKDNHGLLEFKDGKNGKTLAEFKFDDGGKDSYDLSVLDGYDQDIGISTDAGGPAITCEGYKCPDAYLTSTDAGKRHWVKTGGTFTVTFCPQYK